MTPQDRHVSANRLSLHLLQWSDVGPTVLLLHGFLEHAHAWDFVAPRLADEGFRVFALDWRGHGDSAWVGPGGYYHFADYAADLAAVVRALGGRAALVGHSMGAGAAVLYAGSEPERVSALVCVDALGPPDMRPEDAPSRYAAWFADLERLATRERTPLSLDDAATRLSERSPRLPAAAARHLALHGTRPENGARVWKFDPLHQTTSPQPYYKRQAGHFWRRLSCPVLYVACAESPYRLQPDDEAERIAALRAERVELPSVAHHPHLEDPERLSRVLVDFLRRIEPCAD